MQLSSISLAISRLLSGAGGLPPPPSTDPYFDYVTLLLNTTSTNGAQNNTFLDSSTNNFSITHNGDTTQGSFNPYMPSGYWSGYFAGGSSQNSLTTTQTSIGTGNFTFAMWVYVVATPADSVFFDTGTNGFVLSSNSSRQLEFVERIGTTAIIAASASTAISLNTWVHIAVVRSGTGTNQVALYINGTSVATGTSNHNFTSTTISIGARFAAFGGNWLAANAYISNVLYADSALTITLPTAPYTNAAGVKLLCLQDNRFKDNSTNAFAITVNGDTRISKFAPFNPPASYSTASYGGSGYFDGTGDYLDVANNAAFQFGAGDFTIEMFVYTNKTADSWLCGHYISNPQQTTEISFYILISSGIWHISLANGSTETPYSFGTTAQISNSQWHHLAATRSGNTVRIFLDGALISTNTYTATLNSPGTAIFRVGGASGTYEDPYAGYVSSLRLVKGTAVYTAAFTPPTTPLTAIANTSLLLNFTNAGIFDAATINDGQTVGNAQVSTTQAKWPPTGISFDGTGDNLTTIDKPELRLGTGDFTIEGWVYLNATGVAYGLVSKGTATTGWSVNVTSGNKLQFSYTATQLTGATSLVSGTWYYFAVVRSGTAAGNLRVILNGSTDATSAGAVNDNFNQTNVLYVGADRVAGAVLNGYLQDIRITNGYARTTSTPTAAFPTL
jgi:hypothetical protein